MKLPPCLMRMKVINSRNHINLWLPLFLAWILLGALAVAFSPIILVLILVLWPFGWGKFLLMIGPLSYNVLCNLKDLSVDIDKSDEVVLIYFK
jgi:hypothetical protein